MSDLGVPRILKKDPPAVGKVSHHSIELYWDEIHTLQRKGPSEQWPHFSIEEEDPKTHTYGTIYIGYSTKHTVEGLEPSTPYRFRLKITSASGDYVYSPVVSVSTTREPMSGKHLHCAVNINDEEGTRRVLQAGLVNILVNHGADVNHKNGSGKDSLMLACFAGHLDVVKYLRKFGASWESRDKGGSTAMHWAADGGHLNVIDYMLRDGCKVDVKDNISLWTPLMRVSAVTGNADVASLLVKAGADVNMRDKDGKTPLMVAVLNNHEELVQLLSEKGADHQVKNEYGAGVLDMAKAFGRQNIVNFLENKTLH
ncbi:fibronectin type 3 and ankyrin repeat domains protein 1 isoform X2 [Acipenser ruthenus]|uniref:fibronectin type 3 and ankyrin repeat domains protein 1 isoform X2 n=1 Tax=Acipenser ruthenus TaxID=7906 RepID=UPI002741918A|nr:fibronectin type 3 and ankyrin repeat domains protein 1 isoform X2 [Acipenser ruthenus]